MDQQKNEWNIKEKFQKAPSRVIQFEYTEQANSKSSHW